MHFPIVIGFAYEADAARAQDRLVWEYGAKAVSARRGEELDVYYPLIPAVDLAAILGEDCAEFLDPWSRDELGMSPGKSLQEWDQEQWRISR